MYLLNTHNMRKFLFSLAFFAALGASSVYAKEIPDRDRIVRRYDENGIYRDGRGVYHWQIIEREVWVPSRRVGGIFGSRTIPGHYEVQRQRVKIYHRDSRYRDNRYDQGRNGHPHGMPPGQRKKHDDRYEHRRNDNDRRYDDRWDNRDDNRKDRRHDDD